MISLSPLPRRVAPTKNLRKESPKVRKIRKIVPTIKQHTVPTIKQHTNTLICDEIKSEVTLSLVFMYCKNKNLLKL